MVGMGLSMGDSYYNQLGFEKVSYKNSYMKEN